MKDSVCHHDKLGYCKLKYQIKFCKNKHPKNLKRIQIDIFCRFGNSCAYLHLDQSGQGNNKITNEIKVEVENLENATKEGIPQLKATVQHLSEKMLSLENKLAHPKEDPVVEVREKVKHT